MGEILFCSQRGGIIKQSKHSCCNCALLPAGSLILAPVSNTQTVFIFKPQRLKQLEHVFVFNNSIRRLCLSASFM